MNWIPVPQHQRMADGQMDRSSQVEIHSVHAEDLEDLEVKVEEVRVADRWMSIWYLRYRWCHHVLLNRERANAPSSSDACTELKSTSSTRKVLSHMMEGKRPKRPLQTPRAQSTSSSTKTAILSLRKGSWFGAVSFEIYFGDVNQAFNCLAKACLTLPMRGGRLFQHSHF